MFKRIKNSKILFLDIETVPNTDNYDSLDDNYKRLWEKKSQYFRDDEQTPADVYQRAGIYAEFGKIICISIGYIADNETKTFRLKSFFGDNEEQLLADFFDLLDTHYKIGENYLCAHNGKEFDFPFIARRALVNGIELPKMLNIAGKRPWETKHLLDTMEMWKFGDYKHFTSLDLLTAVFDIPTPKDDIDGSQIADVYYKENNLERIVTYCEKDVIAIARLYLKYKNEETINDNNIIHS